MERRTIQLVERLGQRLRPLALAIGVLVSLGLPTTYYVIESGKLEQDAQRYARDLAYRLGVGDERAVLDNFFRDTAVATVRVFNEGGHPVLARLRAVSASGSWWHASPVVASTVIGHGGAVRTVEVGVSRGSLMTVTAALLAASVVIGIGVGLLVYLYPVGVLRGMEARTEDLVARQESLIEAARLLASILDLREVLDRLAQIARSLPGIDVVRIWLCDVDGLRLHSQSGMHRPDVEHRLELRPGEGFAAAVVESGRPVVIHNTLEDSRLANLGWVRAEGLVSCLGVPLKVGDASLGVLACMSRQPRDWGGTEIALAETLGTLAAVAIRNATTFGEMTRRGERLRRVADLARAVSGALDLETVLSQVIAAVVALRSDLFCLIRLGDQEAGGYRLAASGGVEAQHMLPVVPYGEGLTHVVAATRKPLLVEDTATDSRAAPATHLAPALPIYYGVPIEAGDRLLGALNVYLPAGAPPTSDEREAIDLFAGQAAVAIRNARLFGESETRRRSAEELAEVGRVLAQALDPEQVGQQIADSIRALLDTQMSALFRLDEESGDLIGLAVAGNPGPAIGRGMVFPRGVGVSGLAVATRHPVVSQDVLRDPRVTLPDDTRARFDAAPYRTMLAVPFLAQDRVIGVLAVGDRAGRVFHADDIKLAQAFADQAALALENARLYEEATRRRREAEELARVARTLTETLDLASIGDRIVGSVLPLFSARSSGLFLRDADGALHAIAWAGAGGEQFAVNLLFAPGVGVAGRVAQQGVPIWSRDVLNDPAIAVPATIREQIIAVGNRAVLAVPLHAKGELIGVIAIADSVVRSFTEGEVTLLQALGDQAALAIENARLYRTTRRAFEELSQAQAQLVRGETMRAIGELAAGVAHHLNNLLAVVLGRVQLALARHPSPEIARHLDLAERAALDGAEVVRRMRGFSRAQPVSNVVSVDLNEVAEEVIELTRPRWHDDAQVRGLQIETRLEPGVVPPVAGEVSALREVFMNLILNAIDALPTGGRITVRTWHTQDGVHCEVADNGVGMSADVQRRALEPFFTTKGFQSTGLGLSVNYGIIRRHGGDLAITSVEGKGTRVTFRLPVAPPVSAPAPVDVIPVTAPLRILVIDDEQEVRSLVAELLSAQGHEVVQADGGPDGLQRLDRQRDFDLVLTDLGMPGMTGWDVARAVKARRPEVPVGLLTGWGEQPVARPEDRAAADFVLAKPITLDALRAALARVRSPRG